MKTIKHNKALSAAVALTSLFGFSACSHMFGDFDYDNYIKSPKEQAYEKSFTETFGEIDKEQNWNMARRVSASVKAETEGNYTVYVFTKSPMHEDARLLYKGNFTTNPAEFKFDALKGKRDVFVVVEDEDGNKSVSGYYDIVEDAVTVGAETRSSVTRAAGCPVTIGAPVDVSIYMRMSAAELAAKLERDTWDKPEYYTFVDNGSYETNIWNGGNVVNKVQNIYMLNGVDLSQRTDVMELGDLAQFLRSYKLDGETHDGVFKEGVNHIPLMDQGVLEPNAGYTMASDGPITMSLVYKGTVERHNYFGYFYYPEGTELNVETFRTLNKYVLTPYVTGDPEDDGDLIQVSTHGKKWDQALGVIVPDYDNYSAWGKVSGMEMPTWIGDEYNDKFRIRGTKMQLTYFGYDGKGTPTYTFPTGCKIGFFFLKLDGAENVSFNKMYTSYADLNRDYINEVPTGATFRYNGYTVFGLEDQPYGDKDQNDILFLAEGNFRKDIIPDLSPISGSGNSHPEYEDKIVYEDFVIAFEDLGAIGDFDFNDVVLSVSAKDDNNKVKVKLLAAGGTLETQVTYNGSALSFTTEDGGSATEVHDAYGVDLGSMVNTGLSRKAFIPVAEISVDPDFTLSNNYYARLFAIKVTSHDGTQSDIKIPATPSEAPQAILIGDNNWEWPSERQDIRSKYPLFTEWVSDHLNTAWYDAIWFEGNNVGETSEMTKQGATLTVDIANHILTLGGDATTYTYTISSGAPVTATVRYPEQGIVSVDNNSKTITPLKVGGAEIIFSAPATDAYTAVSVSLTVEVKENSGNGGNDTPTPPAKTDPTLEGLSNQNLIVGTNKTLEVTTNSTGALSVSSNNTGVVSATVSGKTITLSPLSAGKATVSVTVAEDNEHKSKTVTFDVSVIAAPEGSGTLVMDADGYFTIPAIIEGQNLELTLSVDSITNPYYWWVGLLYKDEWNENVLVSAETTNPTILTIDYATYQKAIKWGSDKLRVNTRDCNVSSISYIVK